MIYKLNGITDEVTTCDICGKPDLIKTLVLEDEEGNISFAGSTCGARKLQISLHGSKPTAENVLDAYNRKKAAEQAWKAVILAAKTYANNTRATVGIFQASRKNEPLRWSYKTERAINANYHLYGFIAKWIDPD